MRRPWDEHTQRLVATEGHWSDYGGWVAWMDNKASAQNDGGVWWEAIRDSPELDAINLYVIMCEVADGPRVSCPDVCPNCDDTTC